MRFYVISGRSSATLRRFIIFALFASTINKMSYSHQDTEPVVLRKSHAGVGAITQQMQRAGLVTQQKKFGAGGNGGSSGGNAARLEADTANFGAPKTIDKSLSKAIAQARMAKKMTQKDLEMVALRLVSG